MLDINKIGIQIRLHEQIGKGGFGSVYRCSDENNNVMAVKCCDISSKHGIPHPTELSIMASIKHPNLNRSLKIHCDNKKLYIFQDLASGDISHRVRYDKLEDNEQRPDPMTVRKWICSLVSAIACLHSQNIVHADIKSSNILIFNDDVRLSDFTLALKMWKPDQKFNHTVGTSTHRPLENHLGREWDLSLDIWSLGCTVYEMVYGTLLFPFQGNLGKAKKDHLAERCVNCLIDWAKNGPVKQNCNMISNKYEYHKFNLCQDFHKDPYGINGILLKMLSVDPRNRPTIFDIMKHEYFSECPKNLFSLISSPYKKITKKRAEQIISICNDHHIGSSATNLTMDLYARTMSLTQANKEVRILACLWLACKMTRRHLPEKICSEKLLNMERLICTTLGYRLHYTNHFQNSKQ